MEKGKNISLFEIPQKYLDLSLEDLEEMPTIKSNHCDDVKILEPLSDSRQIQISLSRLTVADGVQSDNLVTIEILCGSDPDYQWRIMHTYEAKRDL